MKYQTRNGWTKAAIIARIRRRVPVKGCVRPGSRVCLYRSANGRRACAVGAFLPPKIARRADELDSEHGEVLTGCVNRMRDVDWTSFLPLDVDAMANLQRVHDMTVHHPENASARDELIAWIEENVVDGPEGGA